VIPGDTVEFVISRRSPAGRPVADKVTADFAFGAFHNGDAAAVSPTITDLETNGTWRRYKCAVVLPATKGIFELFPRPTIGLDQVEPAGGIRFDYQTADIDSVYNLLAVPIVSVVDAGGPLGDIALRCVRDTYTPIAFSVKDQAGTAIDLSGYLDPVFAVASQDQATTTYTQNTGITMLASGLVTIAIPETATFFTALPDPWNTATGDEKVLYWTLIANEGGDAAKTRCLARGRLTILRNEA
jgi:hypothetical protein